MASAHRKETFLSLVFLALLTFSDGVNTNALQVILRSSAPQEPGFWNLGTSALIVSTVLDLVGQLIIGVVADLKGRNYAMYLNVSAVLLSSICPAISLLWREKWPVLASILGPLMKLPGGGSHATAFFTVILLRDQLAGSSRITLVYITGAVIVICQTLASTMTPLLLQYGQVQTYIISMVCCLLAYAVTVILTGDTTQDNISGPDQRILRAPLLRPSEGDSTPESYMTQLGAIFDISADKTASTQRAMMLVGLIFFIAAVSKATRPLFTTYIQHRVGVTPDEAQTLWLARTCVSFAIFAVILPACITFFVSRGIASTTVFTSSAGRVSIILMMLGAFMIGLAQSVPVLIAALSINTLGVATDLSILAFASELPLGGVSGRFFTFVASLESLGSLVGIAVLYPIYQICLDDSTLAGGIPYFICGGLYIVVAGMIWNLKAT